MKSLRTGIAASALVAAVTPAAMEAANFGDDVALLEKHTSMVVLSDRSGSAKVVVSPSWQGRVMTSTADGNGGLSYGWINRELIASGKLQPHINVFGGEDRFSLGPFYELESSSPAAALAPAKCLTHVHRTIHLSGPEASLDAVARSALGVSLKDIRSALK